MLVLDAGTEVKRLEISSEDTPLGEGDQFFFVGDKRISNLREFVSEILRVNQLPVSYWFVDEGHVGYVRVAYNLNRSRSNSSNTQYMRLTPKDIAELQKYINGG